MTGLIKSEWLKSKHTAVKKSMIVLPLVTILLAFLLMRGSSIQIGTFNWWGGTLLPVYLCMLCNSLITKEKKSRYFNLLILPLDTGKQWLAKVLIGIIQLLLSNLIVFLSTLVGGMIFGTQYQWQNGLIAAIFLTICFAWQIPLAMYLIDRLGGSMSFVILIVCNIFFQTQDFSGGKWWMIPFSIPARVVAPLLGVNPNGIQLEADSTLWDRSIVPLGVGISVVLFLVSGFLTTVWFKTRKERE
jgi:lantibiotic protection ABC transporter MutE/EpiE family permease subunit